jgi:indolepyruvate ferredoxin oxidoreductase, alpha subunit
MAGIAVDRTGTKQLLMGNEAIARGALEAGMGVAAAYPGNPSSEIIATLAQAAKELNLYVEWSVNEKVALEVAAAAAFAGVRALCAMKQNGLNVALDFLSNLNLTGVGGGLVLVVCDDPGGISSTNEQDSRHVARTLDLPLLEPATAQEAKEMTRWAFELSEEIGNVCILRSVTRISHARENVTLGELPHRAYRAHFDTSRVPYASIAMNTPPVFHQALHQSLARIADIFESSPFNWYVGPENPELLLVTSGSGWLYSVEAVKMLSAKDSVGILKLGTTWPLPRNLVSARLLQTSNVLVVEEIDLFLEDNLKVLAADIAPGRTWRFFGKASGHFHPFGELNPDVVINAVARILEIDYNPRPADYQQTAQQVLQGLVPPRALQFCAGCPHRTTFWAIKNALKMDGRDGFVTGDIGCYSMALTSTGFSQIKTVHSMGSGVGLASGLGKLDRLGFDQPVVTVCGDSTFFHAVIPALINAVHSHADLLFVVLDNAATAMTGFQPHPGIETNAMGEAAPKMEIEAVCRALGVFVEVTDPYDIPGTTEKLLGLLRESGKPRVLISRRECALTRARKEKASYVVRVDEGRCRGESCGCDKFCVRVFKCPGLAWDRDAGKALIDEAICSGCGVCTEICPQSAIVREALS